MRNNLKRVTIVLTKDQHLKYKEYARKYHGSVSQFIRLAAEKAISDDIDLIDLRLRPIFEKLENINLSIDGSNKILHLLNRNTNFLVDKIGDKVEKIAYCIEKLLLSNNRPLSIPEITGYLPYTQEEIIDAIEFLEEKFYVERIKQLNSPSKWKIRGDKFAEA